MSRLARLGLAGTALKAGRDRTDTWAKSCSYTGNKRLSERKTNKKSGTNIEEDGGGKKKLILT